MIEAGADTFAGADPDHPEGQHLQQPRRPTRTRRVTGSVNDALRLGCSAIGFTIYPGSEYAFDLMEEIRELAEEAKAAGLAVVIWSYPRGPNLDKAAETAIDICAYAAHMAALLGAHIIKVKPPTARDLRWKPRRKSYDEDRRLDAWPSASSTSCSPASPAGASSCSPAARRRDLDGAV